MVRISLPSRRFVSAVRVRLVVAERLLFPQDIGTARWEDKEVIRRDLLYMGPGIDGDNGIGGSSGSGSSGGKSTGFWMEKGVTL